jgi:hypothetical protein
MPEIQTDVEEKGQRNPDSAPAERFFNFDLTFFPLEQSEVDQQEGDDEDGEEDVEKRCGRNHGFNSLQSDVGTSLKLETTRIDV